MSDFPAQPIDAAWFEMGELRKRTFANSVWIPLRASEARKIGTYGFPDYAEDYFGAGSLAVPLAHRALGDKLGWMDIGPSRDHRPWVDNGHYNSAEVYKHNPDSDEFGIELVLEQSFDGAVPRIWHVNQDLTLALGLYREDDSWIRPEEGFVEVIRILGDPANPPARLEIKAEFLKDYLAARKMALRLTTYRERVAILESEEAISWREKPLTETTERGRFEARCMAIHEGGHPYGAEMAIFHVSRTDVDPSEDVPVMGHAKGDDVEGSHTVRKQEGRKLFRVDGGYWADEWIEPAAASIRVARETVPSSCEFIIDASGERWSADKLKDGNVGRWLWFKPTIIPDLLARRGARLDWYSRYTGGIQLTPGDRIHFGLNDLDLITVYAKDIGQLPEWQRRIWVGFNVSPEGRVSSELLMSQARATPADTLAPEAFIAEAITEADEAFERRFGRRLFKPHDAHKGLIRGLSRFQALQRDGIYSLAKDIVRLTADSFDLDMLHSIAPPPKDKGKGSLKSLERVIGTIIAPDKARELIGLLVGIYELRLADAHLPSGEIEEAFKLARTDREASPLNQGLQLLDTTVTALVTVAHIVDQVQPSQAPIT